MSRNITCCLLLLTGLLAACTPPSVYEWGNYERSLYTYYKNPESVDKLMTTLELTISKGETDKRVPPGLYAEYGYLLMVSDRRDEAITYFKKEKSAWPESTVLMDKLISVADAREQKSKSDSSN